MVIHKCIITINDKPDSKNNILYTILLRGESIIGNKTICSEFIYKVNDTFCFKIDDNDRGCILSSAGIARLLNESKKVMKYVETGKMSLQSLIQYFKINISPVIEDTFDCDYIIYTGEDVPLGTVNYVEACVMGINGLKKCRLKFIKDSGKTDDTLIIEFCSENGDKIYAFIFRDGKVVFGGSGPYKLSRLQFRFLIEVVHKICKVSYQNIEKYFEDVDEAYEKILTDICLVNNNLFGGV